MAERSAKIEKALFVMEFKDYWNIQDWKEHDRLVVELAELKKGA